jgi:CHRD domain
MKRISSIALMPFAACLGACSSSPSSPAQPVMTDAGDFDAPQATVDGGAGDDSADPGNGSTTFEANLSGAEVTPSVTTAASGKGTFSLSPDGTTLAYKVAFLPQDFAPTAVNLHIGAVGESTGTTHQLAPISNPMTGQIMLTMDEQAAITSDQLYVDVPTAANPNGELRGQLVLAGSEIFVANLTGAQQVPLVKSAYTGHASFIMGPDQGTLVYHVVTDATPTDVRLHRAIGGTSGQVAYDLPIGNGLPLDGVLQIGGAAGNSDPTDLEKGRFYLNVVTQQNPAGELRGQLVRPGETLLTGVLSGANEMPPVTSLATGGAQFVLGADHLSLKYEVVVSGVIPIGAEIGQAGSTLYQLTLDQTGALGTLNMSAGDAQFLLSGGLFVNVRTPSYSGGELRAQIVRQ